MTLARYLLGIAELALVVGPLVVAAVALRRRWLAGWSGSPAVVAETVIALALLIGIAELLGLVGLFRPAALLGASVACGVAAWSFARRGGSDARVPPSPAGDRVAAGVAVLIAAALAGFWVASAARALKQGMWQSDTLSYHAPMAARFVQEHSTAGHLFPTDEQVLAFVPANSELLHAIGILLSGTDVLSPLLNIGWLALALVAAWAMGRPLGRGPATLAGAATALATPLFLAGNPGEAFNDVAVTALLLAAAALLVNGGLERTPLVLAGLAAGLAVGTKATVLVPVAVFAIAATAFVRSGERVRTGGLVLMAVFAGGGFWYVRNLVAFGSPLPTVRIGVGPVALPSIPSRPGYTVADYATDWHVWDTWFLPALNTSLGPGWWAMVGLAALGMAVGLTRRTRPAWRPVSVLAITVAVFYVFIPYSADGPEGSPYYFGGTLRFLVPGLAIGLAMLGLSPLLNGKARHRSIMVVFGVLTFTALYDSRQLIEAHPVAAALAAALCLLSFALAWVGRAGAVASSPTPRGLRLAAGLGLLVLGAGLVWLAEGRYMRDRYPSSWARALHGTRVGILGTVPAYPLYGLDLSNHVQYIARKGAHGAFSPIRDCREWRRAVNEGGYGYVAIGTGVDLVRAAHGQAKTYTKEVAWSASDTAVAPLPDASKDSLVFRIEDRLDPSACDGSAVRHVERDQRMGVPTEELLARISVERYSKVRITLVEGRWVIQGWSARDVGVAPGAVQGFVDAVSTSGGSLTATGWAADTDRLLPADQVLAFSDGRLVASGVPSQARRDVADHFGEGVELCGYALRLPGAPAVDRRTLRAFGIVGRRASELTLSEPAKRALTGSRSDG